MGEEGEEATLPITDDLDDSARTDPLTGLLNRRALDYIDGDDTVWERDPVEQLAQDGELMGYQHYGFWSCMDTLKEKNMLEELWGSGKAPWKIW